MATKREIEQKVYKRFIDAVDLIAHKGYSINRATSEVGMSKNTFRTMNKERGNLVSAKAWKTDKSGKIRVTEYEVDERFAYAKQMPALVLDTNGEPTTVHVDVDKYYAGILGTYWNEVKRLEHTGSANFSSFPDVIYDRHAKAYNLIKDVDAILLYLQMQVDGYTDEIWKQLDSDKRKAA
jgi:hypothetical protein